MGRHQGNQGGRPKGFSTGGKYGLLALAVGESTFLEWRAPADNDHLRCAIKYARKRTGWAFRVVAESRGLRVTRLPDPARV